MRISRPLAGRQSVQRRGLLEVLDHSLTARVHDGESELCDCTPLVGRQSVKRCSLLCVAGDPLAAMTTVAEVALRHPGVPTRGPLLQQLVQQVELVLVRAVKRVSTDSTSRPLTVLAVAAVHLATLVAHSEVAGIVGFVQADRARERRLVTVACSVVILLRIGTRRGIRAGLERLRWLGAQDGSVPCDSRPPRSNAISGSPGCNARLPCTCQADGSCLSRRPGKLAGCEEQGRRAGTMHERVGGWGSGRAKFKWLTRRTSARHRVCRTRRTITPTLSPSWN